MKPISTAAWVANFEAQRGRLFADHRISWRSEMGWGINAPGSMDHAARIIMPGLARIVIIGDGPEMIFRCSYETPEEAVRWLARHNPDHITAKVCAGNVRDWKAEVALYDLEQFVAGNYGADEVPEWVAEVREGITGGEWDGRKLAEQVYELSEDYEIGDGWGDVPSSDLITAVHAARGLVRLLDGERVASAGVSQ